MTLGVAAAAVVAAQVQLGSPAAERAIARVLSTEQGVAAAAVVDSPRIGAEADLAGVRDNAPFRTAERAAWNAALLWASEERKPTAAPRVGYAALTGQPDAYRGRVVTIAGEVRRIEEVTPAANDTGVDRLWRVVIAPEGGGVWPIFVYTTEAPNLGEPPRTAWAQGVFFKKLSYPTSDGVGVAPVIVATALRSGVPPESFADTAIDTESGSDVSPEHDFVATDASDESLGRDLLGQLGYDVSLLDEVTDKQRLTSAEAPAFYGLLGAAGATPASQLARLATAGLPQHAANFAEAPATSRRERQTARAVAESFDRGEFSVTPLFTAPDRVRGELLRFDAVVRRATPIDCSQSDVAAEQGVDRYYELEAFPEDSQNLPIVFCVRELPVGFPIGESLRQPARLAGFFLKQWAYRTRKRDSETGGDKRQFAPLLVGRAPIPLATPAVRPQPGLTVGLAGTAALALLAAALWRLGRRDRAHEQQVLARYRGDGFDANRLQTLDVGATGSGAAKLAQAPERADEA